MTLRRWSRDAARILLLFAIGSCADHNLPTTVDEDTSPVFVIDDGANGPMTVPGFFWLPPTVPPPPPAFGGTFDPNLLTLGLTIDICRAAGNPQSPADCTILKTLNGGTPPEDIRVDLPAQNYSATWLTTGPPNFTVSTTYRAFASVGTRVLGFVDLKAVAKKRDVRNVPAGTVGLVVGDPFLFKFRVETGIPGAIDVTPATAMMFDANTTPTPTQDFVATVTDLYANPLPGLNVNWTSSNSSLATVVSPTGPTNGAGATTTTATAAGTVLVDTDVTISAAVQGVSDLATLTIKPSARAPTAVDDSYSTDKGTDLTVADGAGDLLDNDDLGIPTAVMDGFGGGDLGGSVTDNAPGSSVALAGGTLTVNANGSLTLVGPSVAGSFDFEYQVTNASGSSTATVTIDVEAPPTAVDDMYMTNLNTTLSVPDGPGDLLDNDDLGFPLATLTSFGGGSLGGAVTDNAPGSSVPFAGGTLTVNANGSLTLTTPTTEGDFTFDYRITNTKGTSDATVTIQVKNAPVANDDGPYTVATGGTLNVPAGAGPPDGLLVNDMLGTPAATLTSFGGGSLGGAVTDNAAGATVPLAGGTLTVNSDGSFTLATPTTSGQVTFEYRLTNAVGTSDATVTIDVTAPPSAVDDKAAPTSMPGNDFHTALNTTLNSGASENLMANYDRGFPLADVVSFGAGDLGGAVTDNTAGATVGCGGSCSLTVNADGSFSFTPNTGFVGIFTFDYRIQNAGGTSDATVELAVGVRPDAVNDVNVPATGNVRLNTANITPTPFSVLDNDVGDQLLIVSAPTSTTAGGELSVNTSTGEFAYNPPAGFNGTDSFDYIVQNGFGTDMGTVTIQVTDMVWFIDNSAAAPASNAGRLTDPFNSLAAFEAVNGGAGATDPGANDVIFIYSGAGNYTDGLTLENGQILIGQGAGETIEAISGISPAPGSDALPSTGGTRPVIVDASGDGIILGSGNTIRGLNIGTTSGFAMRDNGGTVGSLSIEEVSLPAGRTGGGFRASNGGALDVTFDNIAASSSSAAGILLSSTSGSFDVSDGSISTTGIPAVNITGGTSGLTLGISLTSVSASGGSNGILLTNTAGSFNVTGSGTPASGGTIQNMTGTDGSTAGIGIRLDQAQNVSLARMQLNGFSNFAIRGQNVTNFALHNSVINGVNGNSTAADEGSVSFDNLLGTATFNFVNISGGFEDNIVVTNDTGTLNMTVMSSIIGLNSTTAGNDGILVESQGSATLNLTVSESTFTGARGDMVQCNATGNSTMDCTLRDNDFSNTHPNIVSGGGGITISGGSATSNINVTYDISGTGVSQIFKGALGNAITVNFLNGAGTATGTIRNNAIGTGGSAGSGSQQGAGIAVGAAGSVNHTVTIDGNTIQEVDGFAGIDVLFNANTTSGPRPEMDVIMTNNSVFGLGGNVFGAVNLQLAGAGTENGILNLDLRGNSFDASGAPFGGNAVFVSNLSATSNVNVYDKANGVGYTGSPNGEFAFLCAPGTASTGLNTFWTQTPRSNSFINGPFALFPSIGVDGSSLCGTTGNAF